MAGYTATPLAKKLGLKEGITAAVVGAPSGWSVPDLPPGVRLKSSLRGDFDVAVVFVYSAAELRRRVDGIVQSTRDGASVWIAWPRRAGGHDSDVTENLLRDEILPSGLVDVKVAALDNDWSGLKFMWRKENRRER